MKDHEAFAVQDQIDISKCQSLADNASGPALREMIKQMIEIEQGMKTHVRPITQKETK